MNYSIANFGHIPYGEVVAGTIIKPKNNSDDTLCNITDYNDTLFQDKILLVKRGKCTFTHKVINGQTLKSKMIIVANDRESIFSTIVMVDDGQGYLVNIPSVMISKQDGDKLFELADNQSLNVLLTFNETEKQEKVYFIYIRQPSVLLGLNIESRETFKLLRNLRPFYEQAKDFITFDIFYELLYCYRCANMKFQVDAQDCLGGGRYCQLDPDDEKRGTGRDVVYQQLHQECLFQYNQTKWWDYMNHFDKNCLTPFEYWDCMKQYLKYDYDEIVQCGQDAYYDDEKSDRDIQDTYKQNKILDRSVELRHTSGILFFPGVVINSVAYRGNIVADDIIEDICQSFMNIPKELTLCIQQSSKENVQEKERNAEDLSFSLIVAFMIGSTIIFLLFVLCIYKKMLARQMQTEIKIKVDEAVNQYMKFYESQRNQ
ncbi:Vacuolar-sorting receptor 1 [Paramecium bursaria]